MMKRAKLVTLLAKKGKQSQELFAYKRRLTKKTYFQILKRKKRKDPLTIWNMKRKTIIWKELR